jgi:hypothetical protein
MHPVHITQYSFETYSNVLVLNKYDLTHLTVQNDLKKILFLCIYLSLSNHTAGIWDEHVKQQHKPAGSKNFD